MKPWTVAASVVAILLFAAAISSDFYKLTSPPSLEWHVLLRKAYSIVAFALVGYLLRRALEEHGRPRVVLPCVLGVAAYSGAIEIVQALAGSDEGLAWNAIDVACGAAGGALGSWLPTRRKLRPRSVLERPQH